MNILVLITTGKNQSTSNISTQGFLKEIATWEELKYFHLTKENMTQAIKKLTGKAPIDIVTDTLYVYLQPLRSEIIDFQSKPTNILNKTFQNTNLADKIINADMTVPLIDMVSNKWKEKLDLKFAQKLTYLIGIVPVLDNQNNFEYMCSFNVDYIRTQWTKIGESQPIELKPLEEIYATTTANEILITTNVLFDVFLEGFVNAIYGPKNTEYVSIIDIMNELDLINTIKFNEEISVKYYANPIVNFDSKNICKV